MSSVVCSDLAHFPTPRRKLKEITLQKCLIIVVSNATVHGMDHGKNLNPHPVIHFLKNKDLQNRYTRKQPKHFSIAPFNQKTKEKKVSKPNKSRISYS